MSNEIILAVITSGIFGAGMWKLLETIVNSYKEITLTTIVDEVGDLKKEFDIRISEQDKLIAAHTDTIKTLQVVVETQRGQIESLQDSLKKALSENERKEGVIQTLTNQLNNKS